MTKKLTQDQQIKSSGTKRTVKRAAATADTPKLKRRGRPSKDVEVPDKRPSTKSKLVQYTGVSAAGARKVLTVGNNDKINWGVSDKQAAGRAPYDAPAAGEFFFVDGVAYKIVERNYWNASLGWK